LTPTGVGTVVADHKQMIEVDGKVFLLEKPVTADFALLAAHRSDYLGNLEYSLTARNFNVVMATAGKTVFAEPDHIVPRGVIPPDSVATPFVCIDYIIGRGLNGQ
jgi:acetate CoA/acetoacetate CoA-transferase alpha subunit